MLGLVRIAQRSCALVFSLLTFCPPGPELRTKENRSSSSGMRMWGETANIMPAASGGSKQKLAGYQPFEKIFRFAQERFIVVRRNLFAEYFNVEIAVVTPLAQCADQLF